MTKQKKEGKKEKLKKEPEYEYKDFGDLGVGKKVYKIEKFLLAKLRLNHMEKGRITAELREKEALMRALDAERTLTMYQKSAITAKDTELNRQNSALLTEIEEETGLDLRTKAINFETFEVTDLEL